jgi:hypothetical protein
MKMRYSLAAIELAISFLGSPASPQSLRVNPESELVRWVVANELKAQDEDHSHWMFRLEVEHRGTREVREVIETKDGDLSRLLSINGRPLTKQQERNEDQRIRNVRIFPHPQQLTLVEGRQICISAPVFLRVPAES